MLSPDPLETPAAEPLALIWMLLAAVASVAIVLAIIFTVSPRSF
jgi:hypothetical protein